MVVFILEYSWTSLPHDHLATNDLVGRFSPDHGGPGKLASTLGALEISFRCIFYNALHKAFDKGAFPALSHIRIELCRSC